MTNPTQIETVSFTNEKCSVYLNADHTFSGKDKTDPWNEPRMYTKNTRSYKKGIAALKAAFNEETTMYKAAQILSECGLSARTYCAMD